MMDDPTNSVLASLIFINHVEICKHFTQDEKFLDELFQILEREGESLERKRDVVLFTSQLCIIAKNIHLPHRKDLHKYDIFQLFALNITYYNYNPFL
jgi:hypothetical protein